MQLKEDNLFIITGASGSGKSASLSHLQEDFENVFDFDSVGVPDNADKIWRQKTTEYWLHEYAKNKKSMILCGQIVLGELISCPSFRGFDHIKALHLDVYDLTRIHRIDKILRTQDMLNWSSWLRMHSHDPQWCPHVIKDNAWDALDFSQWDKLLQWPFEVKRIDTTNMQVKEVAKGIMDFVNHVSGFMMS